MKTIVGKFWVIFLIPCLLSGQKMTVLENIGMNVALSVNFTGASGIDGSWIGLYKHDSNDGNYIYYDNINDKIVGEVAFSGEFEPGYYNFRMFRGNGYNRIAVSKTFLVRQGMILDSTFADNGFVRWNPLQNETKTNSAIAVEKLGDGSFIVAGEIKSGRKSSDGYEAVLLTLQKFKPNGIPDISFGNNGKVVFDAKSSFFQIYMGKVKAMTIAEDGKIIVGGDVAVYFTQNDLGILAMILRFNSNGTIDQSFGDKGLEVYAFKNPGDNAVTSDLRFVKALKNGKILAGGGSILNAPFAPGRPVIIRVLENGMFDSSFSNVGVEVPLDSIFWRGYVEDALIEDDNSFYAIGTAVAQFGQNHQMIYKFKENGEYDKSFNNKGYKTIVFSLANNEWSSKSLMRHPMGGLWVVGQSGSGSIWATRCDYNTGNAYPDYGNNGFTYIRPNPAGSIAFAKAILHNQKLNVAYTSLGRRISMSKINSNGNLDVAFGHSFFELRENQNITEFAVSDFTITDEGRYIFVGSDDYQKHIISAFKDNPVKIISGTKDSYNLEKNDHVTIFPNPMNNYCDVEVLLSERCEVSLELISAIGQCSFYHNFGEMPEGIHKLEISSKILWNNLKDGVYSLKINLKNNTKARVMSKKIIKM